MDGRTVLVKIFNELSGPILESKGMRGIFQKTCKKDQKKC